MGIEKISRRAKAIRKKHPGMQWKTALKQAGAELKKGGSKKKSVSRAKPRAMRKATFRKVVIEAVTDSLASLRSKMKQQLENRLGDLFVRKERARKKTDKRRIQKQINETRAELRKLKD